MVDHIIVIYIQYNLTIIWISTSITNLGAKTFLLLLQKKFIITWFHLKQRQPVSMEPSDRVIMRLNCIFFDSAPSSLFLSVARVVKCSFEYQQRFSLVYLSLK